MPFLYQEKQPKPLQVSVDFYDGKTPHVAVAPDSTHDDDRLVGYVLAGTSRVRKNVYYGDAIITYPGEPPVYDVMPSDELNAYFERVKPEKTPKTKALPETAEPSIVDLLKEQP